MRHNVIVQERRRLVRLGLEQLLAEQPELEVVAAVETLNETLAAAAKSSPDVIICELELVRAAPEIMTAVRTQVPDVRVIALHEGRVSDVGRRPVRLGVDAFASYGSGVEAITTVVLGGSPPTGSRADRRALPQRAALTAREIEVLRHLAAGMTVSGCAEALGVRPKTIDNHKQRIFAKLGVQNQAHAVALVHRMGLFGQRNRPGSDAAAG